MPRQKKNKMFLLAKKYSFIQKIIFTAIVLCICNALANAQTAQPDSSGAKTSVEVAAKQSSDKVMEIARFYVQEQARLKTIQKKEAENNEGLLSVVNKTVEELERRAERQYQNNRVVSIKEDLE
jgi:hypothetical protein